MAVLEVMAEVAPIGKVMVVTAEGTVAAISPHRPARQCLQRPQQHLVLEARPTTTLNTPSTTEAKTLMPRMVDTRAMLRITSIISSRQLNSSKHRLRRERRPLRRLAHPTIRLLLRRRRAPLPLQMGIRMELYVAILLRGTV